jgi:hypothetical protein
MPGMPQGILALITSKESLAASGHPQEVQGSFDFAMRFASESHDSPQDDNWELVF